MRASWTRLQQWTYVPSPTRFGRYPTLMPSMAMTTYPEIRHVPDTIQRPPYVPSNFFVDGWGDHLPGSEYKFPEELGREGEEGVRKAGKVVAEILREVARLVKVSHMTGRTEGEALLML
jgi:methionyl aminopeptidase